MSKHQQIAYLHSLDNRPYDRALWTEEAEAFHRAWASAGRKDEIQRLSHRKER
jgi:hypothetical protein